MTELIIGRNSLKFMINCDNFLQNTRFRSPQIMCTFLLNSNIAYKSLWMRVFSRSNHNQKGVNLSNCNFSRYQSFQLCNVDDDDNDIGREEISIKPLTISLQFSRRLSKCEAERVKAIKNVSCTAQNFNNN